MMICGCAYASTIDELINKIDAQSILHYHDKSFGDASEKKFANDFLVFVTPWHKKGYEIAVQYAKKIQYVCPVWFDLKTDSEAKGELAFKIEGEHNIDRDWIKQLKNSNPNIKIYPRIYLDAKEHEKMSILNRGLPVTILANRIMGYIRQYNDVFDGLMFDSPLVNYMSYLQFDLQGVLLKLSEMLGDADKGLILSFMTKLEDGKIHNLDKMMNIAEKILIMTYDYNSRDNAENPISPVNWIKDNLDHIFDELNLNPRIVKQKLLFGIPMYGYLMNFQRKSKDAIINKIYLQMLQEELPPIIYNNDAEECMIKFPSKALQINYPCLKFVKKRIEIAEYYEVGLFVWEAGQGLDYFYELF